MNKEEFLSELRKKLQGLPSNDIDERVDFYSEMIDDRVEEGKTEEEAIEDLGGTDEVVRRITSETPIGKLVKERIKPKRSLRGFEIALLIIGFPIWLPLLIVFGVLILVAFILLWVLVIVTYSVEIAFIGALITGLVGGFASLAASEPNLGGFAIAVLGAGLALVFLFVCYLATKLSIKITKSVILGIKSKLIGGKKDE